MQPSGRPRTRFTYQEPDHHQIPSSQQDVPQSFIAPDPAATQYPLLSAQQPAYSPDLHHAQKEAPQPDDSTQAQHSHSRFSSAHLSASGADRQSNLWENQMLTHSAQQAQLSASLGMRAHGHVAQQQQYQRPAVSPFPVQHPQAIAHTSQQQQVHQQLTQQQMMSKQQRFVAEQQRQQQNLHQQQLHPHQAVDHQRHLQQQRQHFQQGQQNQQTGPQSRQGHASQADHSHANQQSQAYPKAPGTPGQATHTQPGADHYQAHSLSQFGISQQHIDFWTLLRLSPLARSWIFPLDAAFPGALVQYQQLLPLSRGAVSMYICGKQNCATGQNRTILHRCAGMLFPLQSHDNIVVGHYYEKIWTPQGTSHKESFIRGKYVLCTRTRELLKVIPEPSPRDQQTPKSFVIDRTVPMQEGFFLRDFINVSVPNGHHPGTLPAQFAITRRATALHKLEQPAPPSGRSMSTSTQSSFMSLNLNAQTIAEIAINPSHGLEGFGTYRMFLIPSIGGIDINSAYPTPPRATGTWAPPIHVGNCQVPLWMFGRLDRNEASELRTSFWKTLSSEYQMTGMVQSPGSSVPGHSPIAQQRGRPASIQNVHSGSSRAGDSMKTSTHSGTTPDTRVRPHSVGPIAARSDHEQSHAQFAVSPQMSSPVMYASPSASKARSQAARYSHFPLAANPASASPVPAGAYVQPPQVPIGEAPETNMPSESRTRQSTRTRQPSNGYSAVKPQTEKHVVRAAVPALTSQIEPMNPPSQQGSSIQSKPAIQPQSSGASPLQLPHKSKAKNEALPAPTPSDIVMRNRISAQKSNEKRRKKLEAAKQELELLRVILPQLQQRKAMLQMENNQLKQSVSAKYCGQSIDSYYSFVSEEGEGAA